MVYPVGYLIIYFIIKMIFAKECKVKRLETKAYLLNYLYEIKVILTVRVSGNKVIYYFYI